VRIFRSIIINYLNLAFEGEDVAITYIYCNYKERNQTTTDLVTSLLKQLTQRQPTLSDDIIAVYRRHLKAQTRPSLVGYSRLLRSEVRRSRKVFVLVDALDECSESDGIRGILPEVRKLLPDIHLLVTSRHIANIEPEFEKEPRLEIRAIDEDVRSYLIARIEEEPRLSQYTKVDPALRNDILDNIVQKAGGMYDLRTLPIMSSNIKYNTDSNEHL
jgi:ankyrin repeat domain-containing protein 50